MHLVPPAPGPLERLPRWALCLAVVACAVLPFARALGYPFLAWDDDVNFTLNEGFRGLDAAHLRWMWTSFHAGHYMPLTWMSCALDHAVAGLDPRMFHATSLALHAATALLLFLALEELLALARIGGARVAAAALGACFFAAHPLRVESVVWLTERRDVLSGAFLAASAWAWLRAQREGAARARWIALSLAAFAASLLSKVAGLGLPLVLLALDAWPLERARRHGWRPLIVEKLPYFALALGGAAIGLLGQRLGTEVLADLSSRPLDVRVAISAFALRSYLRHTALPLGLSPFYELGPDVALAGLRYLASLVFAVALTMLLFTRRRHSATFHTLWTAWCAFCVLVAPVIGIVHAGNQIAADRYTYLPSFAIGGLVAAALVRWRGKLATVLAALAVLALGVGTWFQTAHWRDTETLFRRVLAVEPESFLAHHKLGVLAHQRGEHREALRLYDRALELRSGTPLADVRYDRALTQLALGARELALADLIAALELDPAHVAALEVLVREAGQLPGFTPEELARRLSSARARAPSSAPILALAASEALRAARNEEALALARQLDALAPADVRAPRLAGRALLYLGRFAEAEREFARACVLAPSAESHYDLGLALERLGRATEARAAFQRTIELDPSHARARARLAR